MNPTCQLLVLEKAPNWHDSHENVTKLYPRIRKASLLLRSFPLPFPANSMTGPLLNCLQWILFAVLCHISMARSFVRLLPLNLLLIMVWVTYYLAIVTDPGRVPSWYEPNETSAGKAGLRWCKVCKVFKPYYLLPPRPASLMLDREHIIAVSVNAASSKWTTIVRGH